MNKLHEANRRYWETRQAEWAKRAETDQVWRRCAKEPGLILDDRERHWLGDVAGKRVAVLSSGDNAMNVIETARLTLKSLTIGAAKLIGYVQTTVSSRTGPDITSASVPADWNALNRYPDEQQRWAETEKPML